LSLITLGFGLKGAGSDKATRALFQNVSRVSFRHPQQLGFGTG